MKNPLRNLLTECYTNLSHLIWQLRDEQQQAKARADERMTEYLAELRQMTVQNLIERELRVDMHTLRYLVEDWRRRGGSLPMPQRDDATSPRFNPPTEKPTETP